MFTLTAAPQPSASKPTATKKGAIQTSGRAASGAPLSPKVVASSPDYVVTTTTGASIVPGTTDIGNHCDDCGTGITFPFPVMFYDQVFNTATMHSNGNLYFTSGETCCTFIGKA